MDLNEKVEQLAKITEALKNEVNELKGNDLKTRLGELEQEKEALKDGILELKDTLMQQNDKILSLLKEQNKKLADTIERDKLTPQIAYARKVSNYKLFPIKSLQDLDDLENTINDENMDELIAIVRPLLQPKGIIKNISQVMSVPCIMECNVDGHHNKRRLLNSPKFMDLVYRAAYDTDCDQKTFLNEFRRGFKMVKNRYNKNLCRYRQMQRQKEKQESKEDTDIEEDEDMEILPDNFVKMEETEKIYFD